MAVAERIRKILRPDLRKSERRGDLEELADRSLPIFRDLLNTYVESSHIDFAPKRLRQLLENQQAVLAVVNRRRGQMFRALVDVDDYGQTALVVVINARRLIFSSPQQRNEAISTLVEEFAKIRQALPDEAAFMNKSLTPNAWQRQVNGTLMANGYSEGEIAIRFYD